LSPAAELLNGQTDLFALDTRDFDEPDHSFEWSSDDAPPALAVVPKRSLRDYLAGVDLILEALDQLDPADLTEDRRAELSADLISALAGTREKVDNTNRVLAMFEGLEAAAAAEIARLTSRAKRYARQHQRLTDYVLATMEASAIQQLDGETSTLKARKNPPSVVIDDPAAIPSQYFRYAPAPPPTPDKAAIKSALKARLTVEGARLIQTSRLVRT
jgi:hypothetical protein